MLRPHLYHLFRRFHRITRRFRFVQYICERFLHIAILSRLYDLDAKLRMLMVARGNHDAIDIPILVVRGQQSDLLPEAVLKDMIRRNRNVAVHTVQNCGHAPALIADDQIEVVKQFLDGNDSGAP